jgi:hypothetical protein
VTKLVMTLVLVTLVGGVTPARATEFVLNGSVEDLNSKFVNTLDNYMSLTAGATAIADWTVSAGTVNEIVWGKSPTTDGHNAAAGTFFVDLTGFGADSPNGAIEQLLNGLVVGQSYSYSMDLEIGFPGGFPLVTVGTSAFLLSSGAPFIVGSDTWTPETGTFIAGSTSEVLKIENVVPGQQIDFIDNISVTGPSGSSAVPEPATILLLGTGLAGTWRRRQSRNRAAD